MNHNLQLALVPPEGGSPLYMQVADTLRSLIDKRVLQPGEKLPATRDLCSSFEVSSITVEAGLKVLVEENYLVRTPRRGTFINPRLGAPGASALRSRPVIRIVFCGISLHDRYWFVVLSSLEESSMLAEADKLFCTLRDPEPGEREIDRLVEGCDGLILCGYNSTPLIDGLGKRRFPFVLIGGLDHNISVSEKVDAVLHDDVHRAYISTRHLLDLDHRNICSLIGPTGSKLAADIEEGYRMAMKEFNVPEENYDIYPIRQHTIEEGREAGLRILTRFPRPSAVFAHDDRVAVGVAKAAFHLGLRIPEELSIIGGGNQEVAKIITPELTTTPSYPQRSASIAIDKLLRQLNDPDHHKSRTVLRVEELVVGGSTRIWRPRSEP